MGATPHIPMAYSYNKYTGTGSLQMLAVPAYIDREHIKVSIDNVGTLDFEWVNANTIKLTASLGALVKVYRNSSPEARVTDYIDGVPLTEAALDNDSLQAFYLAQEQLDSTQDALVVIGQPNFTTIVDGILNSVNEAGVARDQAEAAAAAAADSEAGVAASIATAEAIEAAAAASAAAASDSEAAAAASETAAANSATTAGNHATSAGNSAAGAANSATAASGSATAAANSASAAATSASAAASSAASVLSVPTGAIVLMPGTAAPEGFIKSNGALLSRVTYAALWAYAQSSGNLAASDGAWTAGKFSPGNGSTTFRIPDVRGEFPRFWSDGSSVDSGRVIGSSQASNNLAHTHGVNDPTHAHGVYDPSHSHMMGGSMALYGQWTESHSVLAQTGNQATQASPTGISINAAATGVTIQSSGDTESRPRNLAFLGCIKY